MKDTNCILCNHQSDDLVLDVTGCADTYLDYLSIPYSEGKRGYYNCNNCGLVYRNPVLTGEEKEQLYQHFRDQSLRGESADEYFERVSNLNPDKSENYEKYQFLERFIPAKGAVMDVGAGMGVFLYGFQNYFSGWSGVGVEPTEGVAKVAEKHGVLLHEQYLDESTFSDTYFDLITSIHVLEHTEAPLDYIKMVANYMDSESLLYIETPATDDIGFLPKTHDRFMCQHEYIFSQNVLCQLMEDAGLEVVFSEVFISRRKRNNLRVLCKKTGV